MELENGNGSLILGINLMNEIEVQDHVADYYVEKRYKGLGLKYHSLIIKEMMDGIHGRILDVGCGTGIIHDLYPNLNIIGIDISKGMLKHHKGNCVWGSAESLPFPDECFDSVVCRSVLHHIPDCSKALREIKRVLKPGGKFVCWETNKSWLATLVRKFTQHGDHFSEYHTSFNNLPELISNFFTVEMVKYQGYVAYPLYGFPDIIRIGDFLPSIFSCCMEIDKILSHIPIINRLGFAVMIKATK